MAALDAADVAVFKHRKHSGVRVAQRQFQLAAPAHLLPDRHGLPDAIRRGAATADRAADPVVGRGEVRRGLDEIQHRVFDPCAGRPHRRVPSAVDRAGAMDYDTGDLVLGWVTAGGHRDGDDRARTVEESMPLRGRVVAERRSRSRAQQRGPELGFSRWPAGERRVHPTLEALPPAAAEFAVHGVHVDRPALVASDDIALRLQQLRCVPGNCKWHTAHGAGAMPCALLAPRHLWKTSKASRDLWTREAVSMIVASSGRIAPETGHDHGQAWASGGATGWGDECIYVM